MADTLLDKKNKIQGIVNIFETGSFEGNYGDVSIFADGPNNIRQITYGKSQTTEYGHLKKLIEAYVNAEGIYSSRLAPYLPSIGKRPLVNDREFINYLKGAGKDPVMKRTQDEFFDTTYWAPAVKWARENGFTYPLSMLVIYDSFIHSGGMLMFLRNRFPEKTPAKGGNEKKWIEQYLTVRTNWLANHSRPILRKTTYRTKNMLDAIKKDNWDLNGEFIANGIKVA